VLRSLGARIDPHLHASEIRSCAGDDLWLSPAYQRDSLCIGFTWRNHPAEVGALITVIEDALAPFEPRPHWGKLAGFRPDQLAARWPRLADFRTLAQSYDPAGKFWNPFLDRAFAAVG
jgi:xylitol oxidase